MRIDHLIKSAFRSRALRRVRCSHLTSRCVCVIGLAYGSSVQGIILFSTTDPTHNTTAPSGDLGGSGWESQGLWGPFLGTAIAPQYFITARHVGGAVGDAFLLNGNSYNTTAFFDDPESDLRLWRVNGSFPNHAQLYAGQDEAGKSLVVFGRGTQRGDSVTVGGLLGDESKGWQWGTADSRQRWGENVVESIVTGEGLLPMLGEAAGPPGTLLKAPFNPDAGNNEAHLSVGDSGGAVFIRDGTTWNLAGINYGVDGPYSTSPDGPGFSAAVFDEGGLYKGNQGSRTLVPDLPVPQPGAFYATRISTRVPWIQSVIQQSAGEGILLQSASVPQGPYQPESTASHDENAREIRIAVPQNDRYFRLSAGAARTIKSLGISGSQLIFVYE